MKAMLSELRPALLATVVLAAITCGAYPLLITGLAQLAFPEKARGSLLRGPDGSVQGSALIGQDFSSARYFHPRPSAAGSGYDAASSGGSNLGPSSRKLRDQIQTRIAAYRAANGLGASEAVPADAVTASASGLDPHISRKNAECQSRRVAQARNLDVTQIRTLISAHTEGPGLGFLGEPGVNVLRLNRSLDALP